MLSPNAACFRVAAVQRACNMLSLTVHASGLRQVSAAQGLRVRVAPRAVRLPQVEWRALRHEQDGAELQLALHSKVLPGERPLRVPAHAC